ncbi:MAG TPA: YbaN family protein [Rubrivivax sp.]|nr:YbaN family protein [Burkholderiales bacterium]HNU10440.1 YbaN family protein [Rubrivivax sp.]
MTPATPPTRVATGWLARLWIAAGFVALVTGIIGIFLPVLPTTPFVLVAAYCFARGSPRWERWLLRHPRFGPMVRAWRARRVVPLRAKQIAWVTMAASCAWTLWKLPDPWRWMPSIVCAITAVWLYRLPSR